MAGDWIKMRGNLWDDPRVGALCDATGQGEAAIVGSLYWLWATADQHTEDGFLSGMTLRQIDRKTGIQGFGQALCAIEWIAEVDGGVLISKFDEHNGASAKRRSTDAQRKANGRKVSASEADNMRTEAGGAAELLQRIAELERELEKEKSIQCTHTPLAQAWALPKPWGDWATAEFPHWTPAAVRDIAAQFADHWRASGGTSADWQATWQKWCRDDLTQRAHRKPPSKPTRDPPPTVDSNQSARTRAELEADREREKRLKDDPAELARIAAQRARAAEIRKAVA